MENEFTLEAGEHLLWKAKMDLKAYFIGMTLGIAPIYFILGIIVIIGTGYFNTATYFYSVLPLMVLLFLLLPLFIGVIQTLDKIITKPKKIWFLTDKRFVGPVHHMRGGFGFYSLEEIGIRDIKFVGTYKQGRIQKLVGLVSIYLTRVAPPKGLFQRATAELESSSRNGFVIDDALGEKDVKNLLDQIKKLPDITFNIEL